SSIRIDPLANFNNPSDLATRIAELMPGGERAASFRDFAWSVLNAIILGMIELGEKPTLVTIRGYVNNGVADLLLRVLLKYLDGLLPPSWEPEVAAFARTLPQPKGRRPDEGEINVRGSLNLLLAYYGIRLVPGGHMSEAVETLATIFRHEAAHYTKMIATLKPIMSMLTTGELGALLSPDPADVSDPRPMTDLFSLIRSNAVVYIGLDSLANKTISSAVGALLLSDLTSAAAAIYNFDPPATDRQKIFLVVDEAPEVVNRPYLAMLNKSPGAGFVNIASMQTASDMAARLESEDLALQAFGNFNNLVAMRLKDRASQEFVTRVLGETFIHAKQVIMGTTTGTADNLAHFTGSVQERVTETLEDFFPPDLLGQMPNWQYIGAFSGGKVVKGRLPIIRHAHQ
ncbi:MAG: conjugative transfer system coupling protein TraD, partial [Rhodocyclaceae bacterium]